MDDLIEAVKNGDFHFLRQNVTLENVNGSDFNGYTLLHEACELRNPDMMRWLIECNANVNSVNRSGDTPLKMAITYASYECVELLIRHGADPTILNDMNRSALHSSAYFGHADILELLLSHYPPRGVFEIDTVGDTCLIDAVHSSRSLACVQTLLKWGSDVEYVNGNYNALTHAIYDSFLPSLKEHMLMIIKLLIDYGARLENSIFPIPDYVTAYAENRNQWLNTCVALLLLRRMRSRAIQRNGRDLLRIVAQNIWSQRLQ